MGEVPEPVKLESLAAAVDELENELDIFLRHSQPILTNLPLIRFLDT